MATTLPRWGQHAGGRRGRAARLAGAGGPGDAGAGSCAALCHHDGVWGIRSAEARMFALAGLSFVLCRRQGLLPWRGGGRRGRVGGARAMSVGDAFVLLAVGGLAGAYGTVIGAGGGFLLAPLLVLLFDIEPAEVVGTSLGVVLVNGLSGTAVHMRQSRIDWGVALRVTILSLPASLAASYVVAEHVSGPLFKIPAGGGADGAGAVRGGAAVAADSGGAGIDAGPGRRRGSGRGLVGGAADGPAAVARAGAGRGGAGVHLRPVRHWRGLPAGAAAGGLAGDAAADRDGDVDSDVGAEECGRVHLSGSAGQRDLGGTR